MFTMEAIGALCTTIVGKILLAILVYLVAVAAMILVKTPLGLEANGAYRWIDLKFVTVQPSEIMKVALVLVTLPGTTSAEPSSLKWMMV